MLSQCSVTYVSEIEERKKSLFAFKLSQTGCPSVYLLADDQLTLAKWMMSLQAEGSKVQMDTDLAAEVHEKRLTQKARQARELGMSPDDRRLAKQVELQLKRNSCPVFSIAELHFLEGSADPGDTSMRGDKSGANEKGNNSMQSRTTDTFTGLPADIYEEEYSDVPCGIHDEPPMSKCEANTISTIDNLTLQQAYCILQPSQPQSNDICDAVSIPVQTNELPESKRPTQFSAISHEVNPTAKPRRVRTSKFSMDVKNESEKLLQSAMAAVRRTASLDKAVVQRPARFMPALSRPPSLYRSSPSQTSPSEDSDRVTSFFSPASCSPDDDIDAVDFGGSSSSVRNTLGDNDSRDPLPPTSGSHVQCESYVIPSQIHELALKEAWSKDEDFLLGVIKDQLRLRSQGEAGVARDVRGSDETVLIVNEEWGAGKDGKKQLSAPPKKAMESGETSDSSDPEAVTSFRKHPSIDEHSNATSGSMSASFTGSVTASSTGSLTSGVLNSGIDSGKMQGFVDKRGFDDKWTRFWCVLRQGCLYFYLRAEDRASTDVTDLSGYEATQLIDSFPGRRFILRLDHKDYITVIVSLDTRDDLTSWYQAVKAAAVPLKKKPSFSSQISDDVARPSPDETDARHPSPSAQTVKEKLLAEMLRQKEELEKIQAARLSLRNQDTDFQLSQLRGSSPTAAADQICALTRLKQRRMSTQIKLDAIKKHIGDTSASKERKTVFQIGRRKPDLVPLEVQGQKNDLEEQVKSLSSRLEALDTCITSHGATSPREAEPTDKSILKKGYSRYASDLNLSRATQLANESKKEIFYGSNGDISARLKDKDMSRSTSLKSSVQKLAHRTFGRANWHWSRKSTSPTEDKEDTKANPPMSPPNYLSEVTPDVIDMTNNNTQVNGKLSMMVDGKDICAPPDGFKTDYKFLSSTLPKNRGVVSVTTHRSYTMSTSSSALSSSSTHLDRLSKRLIPSSSFPSLVESMVSEVGQVQGHRFLTAQKTNGQLPVSTAALDSVDSSGRTLAKGRSASLRREVTPSTLAQIEAFEELSNKFLKDSSK
ncbi:unnamed protein product [Lymnaea stagnalis]|uniref:PH domain-containing protein n=1 Tax=Lymnaea stagnalis TaxID=6523 RepID=A0AAV2HK42_LYMST